MNRRVFIKQAAMRTALAAAGSSLALKALAEDKKSPGGAREMKIKPAMKRALPGIQQGPGMIKISPRNGQPFNVTAEQKAAFDGLPANLKGKLRTPRANETSKMLTAAQLRELGSAYETIAKLDPGAAASTTMCPW
ncbi:MAG: hypothetical protein GY937_15945 [bacterium]|nr:hypothetical protein [bacterium]